MKKGLKIALIVLEVIFIVLTVLAGAYAVYYGVLFACEGDSVDPFIAVGMLVYCFIAIIASVQFLLPAASLHAFRKSFKAETNRPALPGTIALISSVIGNLVFYMVLILNRYRAWCTLWLDPSVVHAVERVSLSVWILCTFICISSLIAARGDKHKNKRGLKAAADQGDPDKPLS